MSAAQHEQSTTHRVVVNHEAQHLIRPADREMPRGWDEAGKAGSREECLTFIEETWTDMRPLGLGRSMRDDGPGVSSNRADREEPRSEP